MNGFNRKMRYLFRSRRGKYVVNSYSTRGDLSSELAQEQGAVSTLGVDKQLDHGKVGNTGKKVRVTDRRERGPGSMFKKEEGNKDENPTTSGSAASGKVNKYNDYVNKPGRGIYSQFDSGGATEGASVTLIRNPATKQTSDQKLETDSVGNRSVHFAKGQENPNLSIQRSDVFVVLRFVGSKWKGLCNQTKISGMFIAKNDSSKTSEEDSAVRKRGVVLHKYQSNFSTAEYNDKCLEVSDDIINHANIKALINTLTLGGDIKGLRNKLSIMKTIIDNIMRKKFDSDVNLLAFKFVEKYDYRMQRRGLRVVLCMIDGQDRLSKQQVNYINKHYLVGCESKMCADSGKGTINCWSVRNDDIKQYVFLYSEALSYEDRCELGIFPIFDDFSCSIEESCDSASMVPAKQPKPTMLLVFCDDKTHYCPSFEVVLCILNNLIDKIKGGMFNDGNNVQTIEDIYRSIVLINNTLANKGTENTMCSKSVHGKSGYGNFYDQSSVIMKSSEELYINCRQLLENSFYLEGNFSFIRQLYICSQILYYICKEERTRDRRTNPNKYYQQCTSRLRKCSQLGSCVDISKGFEVYHSLMMQQVEGMHNSLSQPDQLLMSVQQQGQFYRPRVVNVSSNPVDSLSQPGVLSRSTAAHMYYSMPCQSNLLSQPIESRLQSRELSRGGGYYLTQIGSYGEQSRYVENYDFASQTDYLPISDYGAHVQRINSQSQGGCSQTGYLYL